MDFSYPELEIWKRGLYLRVGRGLGQTVRQLTLADYREARDLYNLFIASWGHLSVAEIWANSNAGADLSDVSEAFGFRLDQMTLEQGKALFFQGPDTSDNPYLPIRTPLIIRVHEDVDFRIPEPVRSLMDRSGEGLNYSLGMDFVTELLCLLHHQGDLKAALTQTATDLQTFHLASAFYTYLINNREVVVRKKELDRLSQVQVTSEQLSRLLGKPVKKGEKINNE